MVQKSLNTLTGFAQVQCSYNVKKGQVHVLVKFHSIAQHDSPRLNDKYIPILKWRAMHLYRKLPIITEYHEHGH